MKLTHKLIPAVILAVIGTAHADPLTVVAGGATFTGSGALTFSSDLLGALDTAKITTAAYGKATPTITKDTDGFYTNISVSAPISSLVLDTNTFDVTNVNTKGGLTLTAPVVKSVSSGGSLTVTDLKVDLTSKTIYATLIGGNGVGTLSNFALWNYSTLVGPTTFTKAGDYIDDISGLSLTAAGTTAFTQSLGLLSLGKAALSGITDYGTIHSAIHTVIDPSSLVTPAIPEPSTYALMGLGVAGIALARRRKAA